jgi:hypothetical protein
MSTTSAEDKQSNVTVSGNVGTFVEVSEMTVAGASSEQKTNPMDSRLNDLEQFFRRPVRITGFYLNSVDALNASVVSAFDPFDKLRQNTAVAKKMHNFHFYRADVVLKFEVEAPSSYYGAYVVTAMPIGHHDIVEVGEINDTNNPWQCPQTIHGVLNIGCGNSVELRLPFMHNKEWAKMSVSDSINEYARMWEVRCFCWCPLRSATSDDVTNELTVHVYAHYENMQFMCPRVEGKKHQYPSKEDKMSTKVASAGSLMQSMSEIPIIGGYLKPVAAGLSVAATALDKMGFTRAQKEETPSVTVTRPFSALTSVAGYDTSENIAMYPGTSSSIDASLVGPSGMDELSLDFLWTKWTVVKQVQWLGTSPYGTFLATLPVTPGLTHMEVGNNYYYPSPAAYVGHPFTFWHGSMQYMFYVPLSAFHKGKLQVFWSRSPITVLTTDITNQLYNVVFDVTNSNRLCVEVDWQHPNSMLRMMVTPGGTQIDGFANGYLHLMVAGSLQGMSPTALTYVTILARPSPNLRFSVPKAVEPGSGGADAFATSWYLQGGFVVADEEEIECVKLVPSSHSTFGSAGASFETFDSVRPLLQKFTHFFRCKLSEANHWTFPHYLGPPTQYEYMRDTSETHNVFALPYSPSWSMNYGELFGRLNTPYFTWYGWMSQMYVGVTGGARIKILSSTLNQEDVAAANRAVVVVASSLQDYENFDGSDNAISVGDACSSGMIHSGWQVLTDSVGAEFNFPGYNYEYLFEPRSIVPNVDNSQARREMQRIRIGFPAHHTLPTGSDKILNFFYAGSSDANGVYFKKVPMMKFERRVVPMLGAE